MSDQFTRRDQFYVSSHLSVYLGSALLNWPKEKRPGRKSDNIKEAWQAEKDRHDEIIINCGPPTWTPMYDIAMAFIKNG